MTRLVFSLIFVYTIHLSAFSPFEPSIECTVIKIFATQKAFGFSKLPTIYQSINNNPISSTLFIAGREFPKLDPVSELKTETYEKISIKSGNDQLELELRGKPISRNGKLTVNGQVVADVTCH